MTTTSSLTFATMEVPALDDTMEMASPYQGHADDFDIDLDAMEDQISNADRDMTGAEDYPDASLTTDFNHVVVNDEDMTDDVAEPPMVDADDQYPEPGYNVEMQYGAEETYEAEMLEDEYVEDIDAPVPEIQEVPTSHGDSNNRVPQEASSSVKEVIEEESGKPTTETYPETGAENIVEHDQEPEEAQEQPHGRDNEDSIQEPALHLPESDEKPFDGTNEAVQVDIPAVHPDDNEHIISGLKDSGDEEYNVSETQPPVDQQKKLEVGETEEQETYKSNVHEPEQEHEQEPVTTDHATSLHPVKVYYQDNEISLFPPQEGDASETFFLKDANLAYGSFGKLFESCREVLHDHVEDNEVLVVDIECLNIQLTEDSLHISKVTLSQIVDLYLRLCHNDGVDEPEPLYLTMSTRLTTTAEISNLLLAANEGKGLSEILSWDDYYEAETGSAEVYEGHDQDPELEEPQHDVPESHHDHHRESFDNYDEVEAGSIAQETEAQQEDQGFQEDDEFAPVQPLGDSQEAADNEEGEIQETSNIEAENIESIGHQSPDEESYDSEEQKTESTTTITQLPVVDFTEEQQYDDESTNVSHDVQTDGDAHNEYHETEDTGDENHHEDETNLDFDDAEGEGNGANDVYGNVDPSSEFYEHAHSADDAAGTAPQDKIVGADNDSEPVLGGASPGLPARKARDTPDLADDSLGFTEDLLKSPAKVSEIVNEEVEESIEPGEIFDETENTSPINVSKDDTEELAFDEEEYIDLGTAEELGVGDDEGSKLLDNVPTKRFREPEDEFELAESPTPDIKRSRSS